MEAVAVGGLKAGLPERQMSGCQAWPRSSESLDSWPVWFWAWSALDWQCPSSPCSCSTPESSPSCSLWAAPSPCPASPFCGVLTITLSTCSAGRGFPLQGKMSSAIFDFFSNVFQHLPHFPHPHPLLCHGPPVCHSHSNCSMCPGKPCACTFALPIIMFEWWLNFLSRLWLLFGLLFHIFLEDRLVSGDVNSVDMQNFIKAKPFALQVHDQNVLWFLQKFSE